MDLNPGGSNSDNWRKRKFSSKGEVKELWKHKDRLHIDGEGILRLRFNGGPVNEANPFVVMEKNRIVVPESYRSEIMKLVHRSATAGHMGNNRTWRRARNNFWWPRMKQEIEKFVQGCEECGVNKHVNHPNKAPAGVTSIPGEPLDKSCWIFSDRFKQLDLIHTDTFSKLKTSLAGLSCLSRVLMHKLVQQRTLSWNSGYVPLGCLRGSVLIEAPTLQPRYFGNCASEWGLPTKWDLRNIPRVRLRWKGRIS